MGTEQAKVEGRDELVAYFTKLLAQNPNEAGWHSRHLEALKTIVEG